MLPKLIAQLSVIAVMLSLAAQAGGKHAPIPSPSPSASPSSEMTYTPETQPPYTCLDQTTHKLFKCPDGVFASPSPGVSPKPVASTTVTINPGVSFDPVDYYSTPEERLIILSAGGLINAMVNSDCFAHFFLVRKLIQTNGLANQQVIDKFRGLAAHVPVEMYYSRFTTAEAYRQPPSTTVHLNRKYFDRSTPVDIWAATLGHEGFGHALGGFDHDFKWSPSRSFSVPYSIGGADEAQGGDVFDTCFKGGQIVQ